MRPEGAHRAMDFGAVGDGQTMDTAALQAGLNACHESGGGTFLLTPGNYLSGALRLPSNVTLHLEKGARLVGSTALDDYHIDGERVGLIHARDAENVAIAGEGVIDGQGDAFADWDSMKPGGSSAAWPDGPVSVPSRPGNLVVFSNCRNVVLRDITIRDAPFWTVHLDGCEGGRLLDLRIRNNPLVPNNDGIHCTSCRNVFIRGCDIAAGDDCIAVTGINDHAAIIPGFIGYDMSTENIVVSDCVLASRSSGIRVGYGHNDVRHCSFSNCIIRASSRGVGVFARNPGSVEDIVFSDMQIETKRYRGAWWGNAECVQVSAVRIREDEPVGRVRGIRFRGIRARGENGILVCGLEDGRVEDIVFDEVDLAICHSEDADEAGVVDTRPAWKEDLGMRTMDLAAVQAEGVAGLTLRNLAIRWGDRVPGCFRDNVRVERFSRFLLEGLSCQTPPRGAVLALGQGRDARLRGWGFVEGDPPWVSVEDVDGMADER